MSNVCDAMIQELESKNEELKKLQDYFEVMWNTGKDSACFEQNAISHLLCIQKIKTEIEKLSYYITLAKATE